MRWLRPLISPSPGARARAVALLLVVLAGVGLAVARVPQTTLTLLGMAVIAALAFQLGYRSLLFMIAGKYYLVPIAGISAVVYWGDLVTIGLAAGWLLRLAAGRERLPAFKWLFIALALPFVVYAGHVAAGHSLSDSMVAGVRQVEFAAMLLMLISYLHAAESRLVWYVRASLVLGVAGSLCGILFATDYSARYGLLPEFAPSMSVYVSFYVFALLAWADSRLTASRALLVAATCLVFAVSILSSMSRNLFVMVAIGLALYLALRPGTMRMKVSLLGLMMAGVVAVLLVSPANLTSRISDIWTDPAFANPQQVTNSGVSFRFASWKMATLMWRDHPIAGVGPRAWATVHDEYLAKLNIDPSKLDSAIFDKQAGAHSEFFQNLAETGVAGVAAFLGLYLLAFGYAWRDWRRVRLSPLMEPYFRASLVCAALLLWSYVLGGVTEIYRFAVVPLAMPFILRALPTASGREASR